MAKSKRLLNDDMRDNAANTYHAKRVHDAELKANLDSFPKLLNRSVNSFGTEAWCFEYPKGHHFMFSNDEGEHLTLKQAIAFVFACNKGARK